MRNLNGPTNESVDTVKMLWSNGGRNGRGRGEGVIRMPCMAAVSYITLTWHPYNTGTEHAEFSPAREALVATRVKCGGEFCESHKG